MSTIVSGALLPPRIERPAPKAAALPVAPLRAKQTDAMGHSARAKFKREVRVQRREQAGDKEQERKSAVQLALECHMKSRKTARWLIQDAQPDVQQAV